MKTAKTLCITLPPELLAKARKTAAREHRTMSELVREALRRYIGEASRSEPAPSGRRVEGSTAERGSDVLHSFRMVKPPGK
jgi:metal-responsive CopG/Arc/MetJ family transcriptional regulator